MKTKAQLKPEEMRAYIAQEIEKIKNEIEQLRMTAEASREGSEHGPQEPGIIQRRSEPGAQKTMLIN